MGTGSCSPCSVTTRRAQARSFTPSIPPTHGRLMADGLLAALARPYSHGLLGRIHEHASIADLAGVRGTDDRLNGLVDDLGGDNRLDLELRQQRDVGPRTAVLLGVPLLAPAAHHLADREARHAQLVEGVLHLLKALGRMMASIFFIYCAPSLNQA